MQTKKVYLAVPIIGNSVGDMGALSSVLFAREALLQRNVIVKVQCVHTWEEMIAEAARFRPDMALIVEGRAGKVDIEVFHQVLPDWDRYERSYMAASDVMFHSRRLRKMHNRYIQAGYMMQWLQRIEAPAVYVRLGIDALNLDEMLSQGRAFALGILQNQ